VDLHVPWEGFLLLLLALAGLGIWIFKQKRGVPWRRPADTGIQDQPNPEGPGFFLLSPWERSELGDIIAEPRGSAVLLPQHSPEWVTCELTPLFASKTDLQTPIYLDAAETGALLLIAPPPDPHLLLEHAKSWAATPTVCLRLPSKGEYCLVRPGDAGTWVGVSEHGQRVVWNPTDKQLLRRGSSEKPFELLHCRMNPDTARRFKY